MHDFNGESIISDANSIISDANSWFVAQVMRWEEQLYSTDTAKSGAIYSGKTMELMLKMIDFVVKLMYFLLRIMVSVLEYGVNQRASHKCWILD